MPPQPTGKQRAGRIPLDYFKRPGLLERGKLWLLLLAVLASGAWVGLVWSGCDRRSYSRGPVANVHATWDSSCAACHEPYRPIRQTCAPACFGEAHASNQRCRNCHAGPPHYKDQAPDRSCASCHRDHRGRDASLVSLADSDCTQCHKSLDRGSYHKTITAFHTDHPPFKVRDATRKRVELSNKTKDPGRLTFSHKVHLTLGIPGVDLEKDQKFVKLLKYGDLTDPTERQRYWRQNHKDAEVNPETLVQLDCAACHQLDSSGFGIQREQLGGLPGISVLPARAPGAYMLPITYENQCRACHPLTFEGQSAAAVPHRLQPEKVHEFLERFYTAQLLEGKNELFEHPLPRRPRPGKLPEQETAKARAAIVQKVEAAEKYVFSESTCGKCHLGEPAEKGVAPQRIEPPAVPDVWFEHARFNHAAHRAVDCLHCHQEARTATTSAKVMLPGIDNCRQCHAPASHSGGKLQGGARFHCTECHRYHNGEHPLQGIGTPLRDPMRKLDVQEFLKGMPGKEETSTPRASP